MKNPNRPPSFLAEYYKLEKLNKYKDPLLVLNSRIDWESFRTTIEKVYQKTDPDNGGRPSYDKVMMFKILILQKLYELSDDATEYQIFDRWTFMRFLGLTLKRHKRKFDIQTIGLERATPNITLKNIVYNLHQTIKLLGNKTTALKLALMF